MNTEIQERLEKLALKRSVPFCYGCYREAPTGRCATCGSDDLMRLKPQSGCEYGTYWLIREIISEELTAVNTEEAFEESVRGCYDESVKVLWLDLDAVAVAKEMDPVSWRIAVGEWEDSEASEGSILTFDNGSTYYWTHDVEQLLDDSE